MTGETREFGRDRIPALEILRVHIIYSTHPPPPFKIKPYRIIFPYYHFKTKNLKILIKYLTLWLYIYGLNKEGFTTNLLYIFFYLEQDKRILICTDSFKRILICTDSFKRILICTDPFKRILICTDSFKRILICTESFKRILICTDLYRLF